MKSKTRTLRVYLVHQTEFAWCVAFEPPHGNHVNPVTWLRKADVKSMKTLLVHDGPVSRIAADMTVSRGVAKEYKLP